MKSFYVHVSWWRLAIAALCCGIPLASAQPVAQLPGERGLANGRFAAGELIIQFKEDALESDKVDALARANLHIRQHVRTAVMERRDRAGFVLAGTPLPVEEALARLENHPAVEFAEPDWIVTRQSNDPHVLNGNLWGVYGSNTSPANVFGTGAATVWAAGFTGANNVYVGVLDEGVQWQHPELMGNAWNNPFEKPNDGIDNDGNGYIDDVRGWNFHGSNNQLYTAGADTHGTHVAGTIAATGGNGQGIAGINWRITFIPVKFLHADGGRTSDAIKAIDYFVDLKERHRLNLVAINNSWGGGGYSRALNDAFLRAAKADILMVVAAGNGDANGKGLNNDVTAMYPANFDTTRGTQTESGASYNAVISVAAIDRRGALGTFSNFGAKTVHLGAPGVEVLSTVPANTYAYMAGTSMAAPHVTGALALYASTRPGATANQIRAAMLNAVTPTASLSGKTITGGRLNIATLIGPSAASAPDVSAPILSGRVLNNQMRLSIAGSVNQRYEIQTSTDLKHWTAAAMVTNTTGTVEVIDAIPPGSSRKFYRALLK